MLINIFNYLSANDVPHLHRQDDSLGCFALRVAVVFIRRCLVNVDLSIVSLSFFRPRKPCPHLHRFVVRLTGFDVLPHKLLVVSPNDDADVVASPILQPVVASHCHHHTEVLVVLLLLPIY